MENLDGESPAFRPHTWPPQLPVLREVLRPQPAALGCAFTPGFFDVSLEAPKFEPLLPLVFRSHLEKIGDVVWGKLCNVPRGRAEQAPSLALVHPTLSTKQQKHPEKSLYSISK